MAFANRIGNLFKQAVYSNPLVCQATRCMSSSRLFVGGISYATDDQSLQEAFSSFGEVTEARIIMDRETGRSRGFGFVSFTSTEEASNAISGMDGKDLQGRIVRVNYATERTGGFRGDGSYGSYGGGPAGGNYGDNYGSGSSNYGYSAGGGGGYNTGTSSYGGYSNSSADGGSDGYIGGGSTDNSYASTGQDDANRRG